MQKLLSILILIFILIAFQYTIIRLFLEDKTIPFLTMAMLLSQAIIGLFFILITLI
jgi:hypothetical protein